ncbi:MAG TPA: hypothetical protein VFY97_01195 [Rhodanobacteraceae bacterium]|nr:hypothetical protein [Rhodanobacteraceae bacterium]
MRLPAILSYIAIAVLAYACTASASGLTPTQAAGHIGETATVCGVVAGAHYAESSNGQPTFINLGRPYPGQIFTIVIFGDYRGRFSPPPETWTGRLCVTGKITSYHGRAEIKVFKPAQIKR